MMLHQGPDRIYYIFYYSTIIQNIFNTSIYHHLPKYTHTLGTVKVLESRGIADKFPANVN